MRPIHRYLMIPIILLLVGCDAVFTPAPLGNTVVQLEPEEWQGTWLAPDMVVITTVLDKDKGRLQAAWVERGKDGASLEVVESLIRTSGDMMFANIRDDNENGEPRYVWLSLDKDENHFTVWSPNLEQFRLAIADGSLPGKETDDGVVLGELEPKHLEMIIDPATGLLNWKDPGVFVRVGD